MSITENITVNWEYSSKLPANWGAFLWYKHEAELFPPQNVFLLISSSADLMKPMYIMVGKQGNLLLQSNGLQIWITFIKVI